MKELEIRVSSGNDGLEDHRIFYMRSSKANRAIPKEAGFDWDRGYGFWVTTDHEVAAKVLDHPEVTICEGVVEYIEYKRGKS